MLLNWLVVSASISRTRASKSRCENLHVRPGNGAHQNEEGLIFIDAGEALRVLEAGEYVRGRGESANAAGKAHHPCAAAVDLKDFAHLGYA